MSDFSGNYSGAQLEDAIARAMTGGTIAGQIGELNQSLANVNNYHGSLIQQNGDEIAALKTRVTALENLNIATRLTTLESAVRQIMDSIPYVYDGVSVKGLESITVRAQTAAGDSETSLSSITRLVFEEMTRVTPGTFTENGYTGTINVAPEGTNIRLSAGESYLLYEGISYYDVSGTKTERHYRIYASYSGSTVSITTDILNSGGQIVPPFNSMISIAAIQDFTT